MNSFVKNIIRFSLFILVQVFVLDKIHLHQMVTPYVYFLFIIWLPFRMGRTQQMLLAFALGFAMDSFRHHPGFHTAACVMIAYIRPFLVNLLIPQPGRYFTLHDLYWGAYIHSPWLVVFAGSMAVWKHLVLSDKNNFINDAEFVFNCYCRNVIYTAAEI